MGADSAYRSIVVCACLVFGLTIASIPIDSVRGEPISDPEPLSDDEVATLWSKEPNQCLADEEYESRYDVTPTAMQTLATCTDITFKRPPDTAERWTAMDFERLQPGDDRTSIYPEGASRTDSELIADAHVSIFSVQPSTRVHLDDTAVPLYIAPEGTVRSFVDYRIRSPPEPSNLAENATVEWSVLETDITEIRVYTDDTEQTSVSGSHTSEIPYAFEYAGRSSLRVEADIEATAQAEIIGNETVTPETEIYTDRLTVESEQDVVVYDPRVQRYIAEYPDGETAVGIFTAQPWDSYTLSSSSDAEVRGVWRYYTGKDTGWGTLTERSGTHTTTLEDTAVPVYVHAYPSESGPRVEPVRDGPTIEEVWGTQYESPAPTVHEHVAIDIVDSPYQRSYGVATRYDHIEVDEMVVHGIVRGTTIDVTDEQTEIRTVRNAELEAEIIDQTESEATVRLTLRDAETGLPIMLENPFENPQFAPISGGSRTGYVTIAGERLETDISGVAEITLTEPGVHAATYHPESWLNRDPAYTGDTVSISWHPLTTLDGWITAVTTTVWWSLPFLVAIYAGLRISTFLRYDDSL